MSTTPTSTASSTAASAQSIISSMGMGSGVDVQKLAQSLVEASKAPQAEALNKKVAQSEARISGYGAISYILSDLKAKFAALDDTGDFNALSSNNSQPSSFTASVTGMATQGSHEITVNRLALGQRSISASGFISPGTALGTETTVSVTLGNQTLTATTAATGTVNDLVNNINTRMGGSGIKAQLINRGAAAQPATHPYFMVISGPTGASNSFNVTGLNMSSTLLQSAQNAKVTIDGIEIQSEGNNIKEAISGVSLSLTGLSPVSSTDANNQPVRSSATLALSRDLQPIKAKIKDLVTSFNDFNTVLTSVSDPASQVEGYGASLVGNSTVSTLRNQIRNMMFANSSTPSNGIKSLRDLGVSIDQTGSMTLDDSKLNSVLENQFNDAVQMMSASRDTPTQIRTFNSGLAGDAVKSISDMLLSTATLSSQSKSAQKQIDNYKLDLEKLNSRMDALLSRYNKQFAAMESILSQSNSLKTSLKSTFEGMASANK